MKRYFWSWSAIGLLLAGVGCSTPTNLTPSTLVKESDGEYLFEVEWNSSEAGIRRDSLKAFVLMGPEIHPMTRSDFVPGRFEASIPIEEIQDSVVYRYKFEYLEKGIPEDKPGSRLSPPYILRLVDQETRPVTEIPN